MSSFTLEVQHVRKTGTNPDPFSLVVKGSDTIGDLEQRVGARLFASTDISIVSHGHIYNDQREKIKDTKIPIEKKIFVVVLSTKKRLDPPPLSIDDPPRPAVPRPVAQPAPSNPRPPELLDPPEEKKEAENRACRICLEEEETRQSGRLITPCRCKGSMKYVHVFCLNEWRALATGTRNFYECPQCKYEYQLERTPLAKFFENDRIAIGLAVAVFLAGLVMFGLLFTTWPLDDVVRWFIRFLRFQEDAGEFYISRKECTGSFNIHYGTEVPERFECQDVCNSWFSECPRHICACVLLPGREWLKRFLRIVFHGSISAGIVGTGWNFLYNERVRAIIMRNWMRFAMIIAASASAWRHARFFILIFGIGHSFLTILQRLRIVMKRLMFQFGQRVLQYAGQ